MKRNLAKILAIALVVCLLVPAAAFAADEDTYRVTVTLSGDGQSVTVTSAYLATDSKLYEALYPLVSDAQVEAAFSGSGLRDVYYSLKSAAADDATWAAKLEELGVTYDPADAKGSTTVGDLAAFSGGVTAAYKQYTVAFLLEKKAAGEFEDVPENAWFADAVEWAVANDITNGTSDTTFSPEGTLSRAEAVTFLWRAYGCPSVSAVNHFEDVSTSDWFYAAVLWAEQTGVTKGVDATHFAPNDPCTRAQQVTFQFRASKAAATASENDFTDVDADAYYADAVDWAAAEEITHGVSETEFAPEDTITRAQAVTMLYRDLAE